MSVLIHRPAIILSVTPTVTAGSYASAGLCVGAVFELPKVLLSSSGFVRLISSTILSKKTTSPSLYLTLFGAKPSGTYTDTAAVAPTAGDLALIQAYLLLQGNTDSSNTSYTSNSANSQDLSNSGPGRVLVQSTGPDANNKGIGTSLWGVFSTGDSTFTFSSTTDLTIRMAFEQF